MAKKPYIELIDLRGGINDDDAPFAIADNEVAAALNVNYSNGNIGTKRGGLTGVSLVGSIFERAVPTISGQTVGGGTGANNYSITMPAAPTLSATNLELVIYIASSGTLSVTPTFRGVNTTFIQGIATAAPQTIYSYRVANPNVAGGTVLCTFTGVCDAVIYGFYLDSVDTAAGVFFPVTGTGATGPGGSVLPISSNSFTAQYAVCGGMVVNSGVVLVATGVGLLDTHVGLQGGVSFAAQVKIGMTPTTLFNTAVITPGTYGSNLFGFIGVKNAVAAAGNEPLRALVRHSKNNNIADDELWAQDDWGRLDRLSHGNWAGGVPTQNFLVGSDLTPTDTCYNTNGVSLHEKLFLALDGILSTNRTHVWTGTVLRHVGLAPLTTTGGSINAPTGANTAPAGTFAGTRYYRVRAIDINAGTGAILRRSEPSPTLTFVPSGANTGVIVTRPDDGGFYFGEGATHWELEASTDNTIFFLIATTILATTTVTDTTPLSPGYGPPIGTVPPAVGEYSLPPAVRHVIVDGDRLLMGGNPTTVLSFGNPIAALAVNDSRISWTPLRADSGVGNDERIPTTARFFQDVDGVNGGNVTHLLPMWFGGIWVFKDGGIYKMSRQGTTPAYDWTKFTDTRGAFMRSASSGVDMQGNPAAYFVDRGVGLCRLTTEGVVDLMRKRRPMVLTLHKNATLSARTLHYPKNWMVWAAVARNSSPLPAYIWCYDMRSGGFTDYDGMGGSLISMVMYPLDTISLEPVPVVIPSNDAAPVNHLLQADSGVDDNGTKFRGLITSKAYPFGGFVSQFATSGAVIHAMIAAGVSVEVTVIRDNGLQAKSATLVPLDPLAIPQTFVTRNIDDLILGECYTAQFKLGDPTAYVGTQLNQTWTLEALVVKVSTGGEVL